MGRLSRFLLLLLVVLALAVSVVRSDAAAEVQHDAEVVTETPAVEAEEKPLMAHANHILVDTEEEADAIIAELESNKDQHILVTFAELAIAKSKCPSGKKGGDLGWFPRGRMVAEFDHVVFDMEPLKLYKVQTQFGWHVVYTMVFGDGEPEVDEYRTIKLWVNRAMPFIGPIIIIIIMTFGQRAANKPIGPMARASHILVESEDVASALLKEIQGADDKKKKLAELAAEKSKCPSKRKGGDLGLFGKGQMVPEFEKVAFEEEIGSLHKVKTKFGWHVILVTERVGEEKDEKKSDKKNN